MVPMKFDVNSNTADPCVFGITLLCHVLDFFINYDLLIQLNNLFLWIELARKKQIISLTAKSASCVLMASRALCVSYGFRCTVDSPV